MRKSTIGLRIGESDDDLLLVAMCVPRSYLPALRSLLTLLVRGRTWDEKTGSVKQAQQVGMRVVDSMTVCNLSELISVVREGLESLESAVRSMSGMTLINRVESCCSSPSNEVINSLPDTPTPPDPPTLPEDNNCRYASVLVAAIVYKLSQLRDLCTLPAVPHEELRRRLDGTGIPDDIRPIAWLTLFVYNRIVALINTLRLASDPGSLYQDIYAVFSRVILQVTQQRDELSCIFQTSNSQELTSRLHDKLNELRELGLFESIIVDIVIQMFDETAIAHLTSLPNEILSRYECIPCFQFGSLRVRPLPDDMFVVPENNSTSTIERLSQTRFRTTTTHPIQPVHLYYGTKRQDTRGMLYLWRTDSGGITVVHGNPGNTPPAVREFNTPRIVLASTLTLRAHPDYHLIRDYCDIEFSTNFERFDPDRALSVSRGNAIGTFELDIYEVYWES